MLRKENESCWKAQQFVFPESVSVSQRLRLFYERTHAKQRNESLWNASMVSIALMVLFGSNGKSMHVRCNCRHAMLPPKKIYRRVLQTGAPACDIVPASTC